MSKEATATPETATTSDGTWLSIWIGEDEKRKLRIAAALTDTTMSKLARELIVAGVDQMTAGSPDA